MESPVKTVTRYLGEWFGEDPKVQYEAIGADALLQIGTIKFLIEYEDSADAQSVRRAIRGLKQGHKKGTVMLVAVPYMGEVGKRICKQHDMSWIDLAGNADISADQIRILIIGKADRTKSQSEFSNVFAPKSSRVSRFLLQFPSTPLRQKEICQRTGLSSSFVSRIVARLIELNLARRLSDGSIICDAPDRLLEAWDRYYDLETQHSIRRFASGQARINLLSGMDAHLRQAGIANAFTGLCAASDGTGIEVNSAVHVYVERHASNAELSEWKLTDPASEPDIWMIVPNDIGIYHGADTSSGHRCVHPVQVYLDMKDVSGKTAEVREALKSEILKTAKLRSAKFSDS